MNAKGWWPRNAGGWLRVLAGAALGLILGVIFAMIVALAIGWVSIPWVQAPPPTVVVSSPTPAVPTLQAPELTVLARGEGVTVLEYEGVGFRCLIAAGGFNVDMVCQSAPIIPAQPTPTEEPKHQAPNGSSEA